MNTQCSFQWQPTNRGPNAQRKDLLVVADGNKTSPANPEKAIIRLKNLGFCIKQPRQDQWVLSKAGAPLRIYLYGGAELSAFANDRALAYAENFNHSETHQHTLELVHDTPCPLPG